MKNVFLTSVLVALVLTGCSTESKSTAYYTNNLDEARSVMRDCYIKAGEELKKSGKYFDEKDIIDYKYDENCANAIKVYYASSELEHAKKRLDSYLAYINDKYIKEEYSDEAQVNYDQALAEFEALKK
ncbi:MAG: EexN family lipoprotein [Campylobacter sp.]|nr:EexN family lipoprotein [Campylobacter sp.]